MSKYGWVWFLDTQTLKSLETTQLVLRQFKNFLTELIQNWIRSLSAKNN